MRQKIEVSQLPHGPGVYEFFDRFGRAIYVGKAKNLALRLPFYFSAQKLPAKTARLMAEATNWKWVKTESEVEALLLEAALIKKLQPKYNHSLKDGQAYASICIDRVRSGAGGGFPRVYLSYRPRSTAGSSFGPFPPPLAIRSLLRNLRRAFPFRDCGPAKFLKHGRQKRGCLLSDLQLCSAPCVGGSAKQTAYRGMIQGLKSFLRGRGEGYLHQLEKEMGQAAADLDFEKAGEIKRRIELLRQVRQSRAPAAVYLENPYLLDDLRAAEKKDLEDFLKPFYPEISLTGKNVRLEAFDVSNFGSVEALGAGAVFKDGQPEKSSYRLYRIKTVKKNNDPAMLAEIVRRRFRHSRPPRPDLVLIDGGVSQLAAVAPILWAEGIPVVGLAKRWERLVVGQNYYPLPLERPLMKLLRRLRDEVHRFVIAYQRRSRRLSL